MTIATDSVLTKKQVKKLGPKRIQGGYIIAEVRLDDECGNGRNSFSITAEIYEPHYQRGEPCIEMGRKKYWLNACGCCHEEVEKAFPEVKHLIKWHLSDTEGPMHYIANAIYHAGHSWACSGEEKYPANMEYLKSTICYGVLDSDKDFDLADHIYSTARGFTWNDQKEKDLRAWLEGRKGALLEAFRKDMEAFGLTW